MGLLTSWKLWYCWCICRLIIVSCQSQRWTNDKSIRWTSKMDKYWTSKMCHLCATMPCACSLIQLTRRFPAQIKAGKSVCVSKFQPKGKKLLKLTLSIWITVFAIFKNVIKKKFCWLKSSECLVGFSGTGNMISPLPTFVRFKLY